ncbi:hypothetical protein FRC01_007179, partial [Tulasnella sp. 417]
AFDYLSSWLFGNHEEPIDRRSSSTPPSESPISSDDEGEYTPAEEQFHMSSNFPIPGDWQGPVFKIRNDYPQAPKSLTAKKADPSIPLANTPDEAPWLKVDFKTNPLEYGSHVKEYCWEGNTDVDFVVQENLVRDWYHAPWMHASPKGREPLKGLTFERSTPPFEFADSQAHALQNWAIGFYNARGASVFGGVWANPNKPVWNHDLKFPPGSCVFKLLFSSATDDQVPLMKGSPSWPAVICQQPDPTVAPGKGSAGKRNDFSSEVRLIQVDWATVDERSPIGWVFGTFMYDGTLADTVPNPWDRLTSVGLMWGNDPDLDQAAFDAGQEPAESWINPRAEELRRELGGKRPSWGYNGRLNGPADNFISACTSCHGRAQSFESRLVQEGKLINYKWTPRNEESTMVYFENIESGKAASAHSSFSADYSLQFT